MSLCRQSGPPLQWERWPNRKPQEQGDNIPGSTLKWEDENQPLHFSCLSPQIVSLWFLKTLIHTALHLGEERAEKEKKNKKIQGPFCSACKMICVACVYKRLYMESDGLTPFNIWDLLTKVVFFSQPSHVGFIFLYSLKEIPCDFLQFSICNKSVTTLSFPMWVADPQSQEQSLTHMYLVPQQPKGSPTYQWGPPQGESQGIALSWK